VVRRLDRLGVERDRGRILTAAGLLPRLATQQIMDRGVDAVIAPRGEVVVRHRLLRQVMRQIRPLAAGPVLIQDRVDDLPEILLAVPARDRDPPGPPGVQERADQRPLRIGDIARVPLAITHDQRNTPAGNQDVTGIHLHAIE